MLFFKKKDKDKSWQEKLEAMQSLSGVPPHGNPLLSFHKGQWSCRLPGNIIAHGGIFAGDAGYGPSPEDAVLNAWNKIKSLEGDSYLHTETYPDKRKVQIIGCSFIDME